MFNIQLYNKIAKVGTDNFAADKYQVGENVANPDAIMVRSAAMHDMEFNPELKAIARAGAGVNNIPVERCADAGIPVFNTPGANANAVKELVVCGLMLASRDITEGAAWVKTLVKTPEMDVAKQVEKGKSKFAGHEISAKKLGVIGLGAIGALVANAAEDLHMEVLGYDRFMTIDAAWRLSRKIEKAASMDEIFANCDYITVHVPSTPETRGMFNKETFAKMKDGVRILNFSRADLVNADDLKEAIACGKVARYVTDFPTEETVNVPGIIALPHLGASTEESEDNCAVMAAEELINFLENGNIRNSVNYPDAEIPHTGDARICVFHKNVPGVLNNITAIISSQSINVENMISKSKKDYAYTILEISGSIPENAAETISNMESVIRVNVIK
ncbi:MAG: phosphoglycerate dehydrogenase [Clostridia bacterium]|nr:phosphoglycerate dehydrogenase [Clostridia bacterium]